MQTPSKQMEPNLEMFNNKKRESIRKTDSSGDILQVQLTTTGSIPSTLIPMDSTLLTNSPSLATAPTTASSSGTSAPSTPVSPMSPIFSSPKRGSETPMTTCTSTTSTVSSSSAPISKKSLIPQDALQSERKYSRSHNQRFHRRFPQVTLDERLINYYSCALIADILLQGYLYISENYFAFYSNIFGYKTKLLIPINEVIAITKEKTAKIIPNAVGLFTDEGKYVFGSLLSRETTFRLMHEVWRGLSLPTPNIEPTESVDTGSESPGTPTDCNSNTKELKVNPTKFSKTTPPPIIILPEDASGVSFLMKTGSLTRVPKSSPSVNRTNLSKQSSIQTDVHSSDSDMHSADEDTPELKLKSFQKFNSERTRTRKVYSSIKQGCYSYVNRVKTHVTKATNTSLILIVTTILVTILLVSGVVLIYRVNLVHSKLAYADILLPKNRKNIRELLFKDEVRRISESLKFKLSKLSQIKSSLEELMESIEALPKFCPKESTRNDVGNMFVNPQFDHKCYVP